MEPDRSSLRPLAGTLLDAAGRAQERFAPTPPRPPPALPSLVDDADGLIRALFACVFTSAAVQGRYDVGNELSEQLQALIGYLDGAIRGIRHALNEHEAA